MYRLALLMARVLEWAGYLTLFVAVFVLIVYSTAMFQCILATPGPGFEFECAEQKTAETLSHHAKTMVELLRD